MHITIRQAIFSDFEQIGKVFSEENRFHVILLPEIFQIATPIMTHEWFDEILENADKNLLVAEHKQEIIGVILVTIENNPDDAIYKLRRYGYIDEIIVSENYRRQGVGKLLMKEAYAWALEKGVLEIELHVWETNNSAISFYEKLGYTTLRRTMKMRL